MALRGDLAPPESAEEDVGEDPEHHLPWESSGGLNRALASSTLPSIATDNVLSGSKKELPVTAAEGKSSATQAGPPWGCTACTCHSSLLTGAGRQKAPSPDAEEQGRKPKSFFHHLLKTRAQSADSWPSITWD